MKIKVGVASFDLPALDRLTGRQAEAIWRVTGVHPSEIEADVGFAETREAKGRVMYRYRPHLAYIAAQQCMHPLTWDEICDMPSGDIVFVPVEEGSAAETPTVPGQDEQSSGPGSGPQQPDSSLG